MILNRILHNLNLRFFQFHNRRLEKAAFALDDHVFRHYFRMEKTTFHSLMEEVLPDFPPTPGSVNGRSISPKERMLCFLLFLAGDKTTWDQEFCNEFSKGSIDKSNKLCINVLFDGFVGRHIRLPTREEAIKEAKLFCLASDFPAPIIFAAIGMYRDKKH
jgi:hypothetical protein